MAIGSPSGPSAGTAVAGTEPASPTFVGSGAVMRRAARAPSVRRLPRLRRYVTSAGAGMTKPFTPAIDWMRPPSLSRETSPRSDAFVRSSVLTVSTARPMPALSFSIETCIATMPTSPTPTMTIHARLRTRRSIARLCDTLTATSATRIAIPAPPATTRTGGRDGARCARG